MPQQVERFGEGLRAEFEADQAIKREGTPSDIAGLVAFLASDKACFITSQLIVMDGGWVMP